ncbi:MAG TPA: PAS domain-containing protein [Gallionella sp.]|nr:PAS domain-containing protein [Gallionella sp.]
MSKSKLIDPETHTILIVDDTPSNLSVVVNLFEENGYRVAIAQDGEEGLQRAQLVQPNLILLDVMMPGIDGFETCRRLKAQESTRDIPVIFMTALAATEHKVNGFEVGGVDYVTKPLQIDEVMARVDTHLKLHAAQKRLEEQNAQLDKHREELELRVAERTAELNVSNLQLRVEIEERIWAQEKLAASEREFRTLAENQPDNLARYDKQCRIIYMNPRLEKLLETSLEKRLGRTPLEAHPGPLYADYQARLAETIATGQPREMELVLPDTGEGVRYHYIRFIAERDATGDIVGALTIGRDITERKQAERELILLNRAVNASSEAAFLMNAQGRFVYVNEAACRSLGYSREELLTMTPLDIDPDITDEFFRGLLDAIFSSAPSPTPMESRHRARDGRVFPIEIAASSLKLEGENYCLTMVRDITARKEAERLLHEQQQAIRAVVENSPDAIARYDRQLRRSYVNPATQALYSLPFEAIVGKTFDELPPLPEPSDDFSAALKSVFERGQERQIELPFRKPNGETGWGDMRIVPEFGPDGSVVSVLSIGRDLTERKRVEDALAAREREFRTLVENSPDIIMRYDTTCKRIYVNPAYARETTVPQAQAIDTQPDVQWNSKITMPVDEYKAHLRRVMETGEPVDIVVGWPRPGGNAEDVRYHALRIVAERDADGRVAGALALGRNITAQKLAEEALREREQRYREIFDNAVEGMYLLEVTDDGRFRNIDINPALAASTGIPREAMIGRFVDDAVSEDMGRLIVEKYRRCVAAGTTITESIELDLPAGRRYYYSTITPLYYQGRIHRLIGISRDITDLKKAERELEESRAQLRGLTARREEAREEERKYIAREVHDELGQILTGLQLNVSVLTHKFAADSQPLREQLRETMMLTDKALGVARNVASALRPASLDMGIASALEWLAGRFGSNTGIRCEVRVDDMEMELDECQAIAVFRIVQESLTNVARHAQADKVDIVLCRDGDDYLLKIRDNGKGFDNQSIKCDSFGLVGMRERALLLGGKVIINSKTGAGTEVEVHIPRHNISRVQ